MFKRTKVASWEVELLKKIFDLLSHEYKHYKAQIKDNLLARVRVYSNEENYIGFSYDPEVSKRYENDIEPYCILKGIKVFDTIAGKYTDFYIHLMHGLVAGYSTPFKKKIKPDIEKIKIENFMREFVKNNGLTDIAFMFTTAELGLINSSDVYKIELNGKTYYHLKDLEDGDFIGMDLDKKIYQIKHDPFEIVELDKPLSEIL